MSQHLKDMTDYLRRIGIEDVPHTQKTYLAHLIGVYRDLESWHAPDDVCRAGLFHSIYGTELFQGFKLPFERREELRTLIGARAELLAYVNCVMDRASFDAGLEQAEGPYRIRDRETGEMIELSRADYDDLCRVHLCDWAEQMPRSQRWDYRDAAYRRMAERLGGVALAAYRQVRALEANQNARLNEMVT
ncbi:MAG: hypothetical protein JNM56_18880 [Planctomycetia bacterium]|nr:hypothetical protein [Planctomycetia bacterium]